MLVPQELPPVEIEIVPLASGMDQTTSSYQLAPGAAREMLNFACKPQGGYYRIPGYERRDGQPAPSAAPFVIVDIVWDNDIDRPLPGTEVTVVGADYSGTAVVAGVDLNLSHVTLTKLTPSPDPGEPFENCVITGVSPATLFGVTISTAADIDGRTVAIAKAQSADIYRADIQKVPGEGPIRGVFTLNGVLHAIRDKVGGASAMLYKESLAGWVAAYDTTLKYIVIEDLPAFVAAGSLLVQGGKTEELVSIQVISGSFEGVNAVCGIIVTNDTAGSFALGAATLNGVAVDITAAPVSTTLPAGGRWEFDDYNFSDTFGGHAVYGVCSGTRYAFGYDGNALQRIKLPSVSSGETQYVCANKDSLFVSIEGSVFATATGNPYSFDVNSGAAEFAVGARVTGMEVLPGDSSKAAMAISTPTFTKTLYGNNATDWNLVSMSRGSGAQDYSLQTLFDLFAADKAGISALTQSLNYGNFDATTLTYNIQPVMKQLLPLLTASSVSFKDSQYRFYCTNGFGVYCTVTNDKFVGHGTVLYPHPPTCTWDDYFTRLSYFGTEDGYVMQNDIGPSFDGMAISAVMSTNINTSKNPRTNKRYRHCQLELQGSSYVEMLVSYVFDWGSDRVLPHLFYGSNTQLSPGVQWDTDAFIWDNFYWDGRLNGPVEVELTGTGETMQLLVSVESDFIEEFTVSSAAFHYSIRRKVR